jgi:hypothetical protein
MGSGPQEQEHRLTSTGVSTPSLFPDGKPLCVPTEEIARLYFEEHLPLAQVASRVGVSAHTVRARLLSAGCVLRPRSAGSKPVVPISELVRLYIDERLSLEKVAQKVGYSGGAVVGERLRRAGYNLRTPRTARRGADRLVDQPLFR